MMHSFQLFKYPTLLRMAMQHQRCTQGPVDFNILDNVLKGKHLLKIIGEFFLRYGFKNHHLKVIF